MSTLIIKGLAACGWTELTRVHLKEGADEKGAIEEMRDALKNMETVYTLSETEGVVIYTKHFGAFKVSVL